MFMEVWGSEQPPWEHFKPRLEKSHDCKELRNLNFCLKIRLSAPQQHCCRLDPKIVHNNIFAMNVILLIRATSEAATNRVFKVF